MIFSVPMFGVNGSYINAAGENGASMKKRKSSTILRIRLFFLRCRVGVVHRITMRSGGLMGTDLKSVPM